MRALAVLVLVIAPAIAAADTQVVTVGGARIEVTTDASLALAPVGEGWLIAAAARPAVWLAVEPEACVLPARPLSYVRPLGFQVPAVRPTWAPPQAATWQPLCFVGDAVTLRVFVEAWPPGDPAADAHREQVLASIRRALRPPLEVVPGVVLDRGLDDAPVRAGDRPGSVEVDGVFLDVSLDEPRCPGGPTSAYRPADAAPMATACVELLTRAMMVTIRDPRPAGAPPVSGFALATRDALLATAIRTFGAAVVVRGPVRPRWANGELPLHRLPGGAWKLFVDGDVLRLHQIAGGGDVTIAPVSCQLDVAPPAEPPATEVHTVPRPAFLPARARVATVATAAGWVARACVPMLETTARVQLTLSGPPDDATARALAAALTDVRGAPRSFLAIAGERGRHGLGVLIEGWSAGRVSWFAQLEVYDSGAESNGELSSARFEGGGGPGYSRPGLRAGLHLGAALERVAVDERPGLDQNGGALFVEGRVHLGRRAFVQAIARGAWFFDLDCTDTQDDDDVFCGPSYHRDHHTDLGWEGELRVGLGARRQGLLLGGYASLRYLAVRFDDGTTETHTLVTLGFASW